MDMIKNDDDGIFFSIDAGLALIPVLILLFTIGNINIDYTHYYNENRYFHIAQDSSELMSNYCGSDDGTILEKVSNALSESSDSEKGIETARTILDPFLKKTLGKMNYRFVELNHLKGKEIASKGNYDNAEEVGVAVKGYGDYLFKLYVWE
jgi:hypothetical protein